MSRRSAMAANWLAQGAAARDHRGGALRKDAAIAPLPRHIGSAPSPGPRAPAAFSSPAATSTPSQFKTSPARPPHTPRLVGSTCSCASEPAQDRPLTHHSRTSEIRLASRQQSARPPRHPGHGQRKEQVEPEDDVSDLHTVGRQQRGCQVNEEPREQHHNQLKQKNKAILTSRCSGLARPCIFRR